MKICSNKDCTKAGKMQPLENFCGRQDRGTTRNNCKLCYNAGRNRNYKQQTAAAAERRKLDPDKHRAWSRRSDLKKRGLTEADFEALLESQSGCAVCKRAHNKFGKRLFVDHDHNCKIPHTHGRSCKLCNRGILCLGCNSGNGITDNIELLQAKIDYLKYWKARHDTQS